MTRVPLVAIGVLVLAVGGCGPAGPVITAQGPADAVEFAETLCAATDELLLAWGNPDTDHKSEAWTAFEEAIERRDTALLEVSGTAVLEHLAAARAANARGATFAPATAANAELEALLAALDRQVRTTLDADGDPAAVADARDTAQAAWQRHWFGWIRGLQALSSAGVVLPNIPCSDGA